MGFRMEQESTHISPKPNLKDLPNLSGKTILQIIPALERGGAERTAVDMAKGIVDAGGRALIASAGGRLVREVEEAGGEHFALPLDARFRLDRLFMARQSLKMLCLSENVDLIHARSRLPAFPALSVARALKIPFLTTYHGIYSEKNPLKRWYNSVMVAGDAIIANSNYTASIIRERYQLAPEKIHVVHRGTDVGLFDRTRISDHECAALREKWRIPENRPVVMLLARLTSWKGHLLAVKAAERVCEQPGIRPYFVFAGGVESETYAARVRASIVEANLLHDFSVVGHVDNAPLALSLADVAIVPSTKPEAFGRSVAEASAMGLPVVAFDHGGATETIVSPPDVPENQATGLRVKLNDVDGLARAIEKILAMKPEERQAMGARGRQRISDNFSKAEMISKTLVVYQHILHL